MKHLENSVHSNSTALDMAFAKFGFLLICALFVSQVSKSKSIINMVYE